MVKRFHGVSGQSPDHPWGFIQVGEAGSTSGERIYETSLIKLLRITYTRSSSYYVPRD
jgi:hypothetical protein